MIILCWHGHIGTAGIMGSRQHHRHIEAYLLPHLRQQVSQQCARQGDGCAEDLLRQIRRLQHLRRPRMGCRIRQRRGGYVGPLVELLPGQEIIQILRHKEEILCLLLILRMFTEHCHQLINRIKGLLGNTRQTIMPAEGQVLLQQGIHAVCPLIPVGNHVPQTMTILVQQGKVHRPGINAHRLRQTAILPASLQSFHHMVKQTVNIPA